MSTNHRPSLYILGITSFLLFMSELSDLTSDLLPVILFSYPGGTGLLHRALPLGFHCDLSVGDHRGHRRLHGLGLGALLALADGSLLLQLDAEGVLARSLLGEVLLQPLTGLLQPLAGLVHLVPPLGRHDLLAQVVELGAQVVFGFAHVLFGESGLQVLCALRD